MADTKDKSLHEGHRDRVREKFAKVGYKGLCDHEVLELILFYVIPRRDTNEIAHALINKYGSLEAVLTAPVESLEKEKFITRSGAVLLNMFGYVGDLNITVDGNRPILFRKDQAKAYARSLLSKKTKEELVVICLDKNKKVIKTQTVGQGTVDGVTTYNREIMQIVFDCNAVAVILAHNHPGKEALPSVDDLNFTKTLYTACTASGLLFIDHILVAGDSAFSFAEHGLLEGAGKNDGIFQTAAEKSDFWFAEMTKGE